MSKIIEMKKQYNKKGGHKVVAQIPEGEDDEAELDQIQLEEETDPQVIQLLNEVSAFRLGQTLDEVRGNAMILSGIAKPPPEQQAVFVKWIYVDVSEFKDDDEDDGKGAAADVEQYGEKLSKLAFEDIDNYCKLQSFKLYNNTSFEEIRASACKFWNLDEQQMCLTDEYFNVLSTYKDTA